jgi:type I restriction enzyme S subunit
MKWEKKKLIDVCCMKTGKLDSNAAELNGEYPFFTCSPETLRINTFAFDTEAVLLAGNNADGIYPLKYYNGKFNAYQRTYIIESLDDNRLNVKFLYYLLRPVLSYFKTASIGTATKYLTKGILDNLLLDIPPFNIQQNIASTLSAYDELIENNLKRIKLLEEAAQLLYRQWFVDFKFPGHEKTKFIKGIPEGWEEKPLSDVCYLTMGQSPESIYYNQEGKGLPFHQGVTNFGFRFVTHEIYCSQENRIAEQGDILCSVRAPVGRLNISLDKIVIGRGLSAIRNKNGFQSFQYYQLKKYFFQEDLIGSGAIFASVTKKQMETIPLLTPTKDILSEFERIVKIYDGQIINLFYQNQRLKEARDILLPRLMDGSIEV